MSWSNKGKNSSGFDELKSKDFESSYSLKDRNAANFSFKSKSVIDSTDNKEKIPSSEDPLYILTPDGQFILVGFSEDQELVYQGGYSKWSFKIKESA